MLECVFVIDTCRELLVEDILSVFDEYDDETRNYWGLPVSADLTADQMDGFEVDEQGVPVILYKTLEELIDDIDWGLVQSVVKESYLASLVTG